MATQPCYHFFVAMHDGTACGFSIFYSDPIESFALLEYMAISQNFRNRGLGSQLFKLSIEALISKTGKGYVILEVDSPFESSDEHIIRQARLAFYQRLGCRIIDKFNYLLPQLNQHKPPAMLLLIYSRSSAMNLAGTTLDCWLTSLYQHVYQRPADDINLQTMRQQLCPLMQFV